MSLWQFFCVAVFFVGFPIIAIVLEARAKNKFYDKVERDLGKSAAGHNEVGQMTRDEWVAWGCLILWLIALAYT